MAGGGAWRLHVLVDPAHPAVAARGLAAFVRAVHAGGATVLQLRSKAASARQLVEWGTGLRALVDELAAQRAPFLYFVDDRVDVALATGADGVHVGQDDLPVAAVRRIAPRLKVGLSVGDAQELARALAGPAPDYLGVGPVYATASKADAGAPIGVAGVAAIGRGWPGMPVVAIGGIEPANVAPLWAAGVAGVAVIGAVMNASDPAAACRQLLPARR